MADGDQQYLVTGDAQPAVLGDGLPRPWRGARYGEAVAQQLGKAAYAYADEGSYFVARNPTIGTGIAGITAAATAAETENLLYVENGHATKRIYLDYLRLVPTAAGTSGTTSQFTSAVSPTARYTSGGSTIVPASSNLASGVSSSAIIRFGALVTTAIPSGGAVVGGGSLRLGVIKAIGDIYQFDFGGYSQDTPPMLTATGQAIVPWRHVPVVLGPGCCFTLEVFGASQGTAAGFEFELGYVER